MIYFAFFQSHINYALEIWSCGHSTSLDKIRVSNKKAIRLMTFNNNLTHTDPLFTELKLLNFDNNVNLHRGKIFWKSKNNLIPDCINHIFNPHINIHSNRPCRNKPSTKFTPLFRTQYKARFLSSKGQTLWNSLLCYIKQAKFLKTFSTKLRDYLLGI